MRETSTALPIGRLLRSATSGFTFGCSVPEPAVPTFGAFVKAPAQGGQTDVIGLVYDIVIEDDPFVRQMVATPDLPEAYIQDQRQNRQVPIEVSVLAVGYGNGSGLNYALPPQPPVTLDRVELCTEQEVRAFTESFDFFRLILAARDAPVDELLAVSIQQAAALRPLEDQRHYLMAASRELARLLAHDLQRLETLLRRIQSIGGPPFHNVSS